MAIPSKTKMRVPVLIAAGIFAVALVLYNPIDASAGHAKFSIPDISGTITITDASDDNDYSDDAKIALSVAMAVAENSVNNGKSMWGKLDVVQGFLVYKVGVLASDDVFHKVLIDAGNGKALYVSDGVSKKDWKHSKHSDNESHKKWKEQYANLTPEEREAKKQQWTEVRDAFLALSIEERAKLIMHFMSMKAQWESLSEEELKPKKLETKSMMEELLPLSLEEKTQKLRDYANSL